MNYSSANLPTHCVAKNLYCSRQGVREAGYVPWDVLKFHAHIRYLDVAVPKRTRPRRRHFNFNLDLLDYLINSPDPRQKRVYCNKEMARVSYLNLCGLPQLPPRETTDMNLRLYFDYIMDILLQEYHNIVYDIHQKLDYVDTILMEKYLDFIRRLDVSSDISHVMELYQCVLPLFHAKKCSDTKLVQKLCRLMFCGRCRHHMIRVFFNATQEGKLFHYVFSHTVKHGIFDNEGKQERWGSSEKLFYMKIMEEFLAQERYLNIHAMLEFGFVRSPVLLSRKGLFNQQKKIYLILQTSFGIKQLIKPRKHMGEESLPRRTILTSEITLDVLNLLVHRELTPYGTIVRSLWRDIPDPLITSQEIQDHLEEYYGTSVQRFALKEPLEKVSDLITDVMKPRKLADMCSQTVRSILRLKKLLPEGIYQLPIPTYLQKFMCLNL